jgi:outer membrane protein assembly factor BamB
MPGLPKDLVYVGLAGSVVALDRTTGAERWRTRLKRNQAVILASDGERLYATTMGAAFCLDPATGTLLWENPLKGLGYGIASVLGPNGDGTDAAVPLNLTRQRRSASAGGT